MAEGAEQGGYFLSLGTGSNQKQEYRMSRQQRKSDVNEITFPPCRPWLHLHCYHDLIVVRRITTQGLLEQLQGRDPFCPFESSGYKNWPNRAIQTDVRVRLLSVPDPNLIQIWERMGTKRTEADALVDRCRLLMSAPGPT